MPRGNRGAVHKGIGIAVAGFILFCAFKIVWDESALRTEQRVKAADAAHDYAASADKEIRDRCRSLEAEAQLICVTEAIKSSRESQREEYDLVAQQQAARWTMIAGGAATFGLLLSIVGVGLVWTTFRETRRSADTAVKNYEAFIKFEGPMLDVDYAKLNFLVINDIPCASVRFAVRNIGRSPAIIDRVSVEGDEDFKLYNRIIASGQTLELLETFMFPISDQRPTLGCIDFITGMAAGNKRLFLMNFAHINGKWEGSIHPDDVLDESHPEYADPFAANDKLFGPHAKAPVLRVDGQA